MAKLKKCFIQVSGFVSVSNNIIICFEYKSGNDNEEETPESPEEEQVPVDEEDVCVENTPQLRASGKFVTNVTSFESDEKMSEGSPEEQGDETFIRYLLNLLLSQ